MRVGEIRNIIDSVTNETGQIVIEGVSIYGGQAYTVRNFRLLLEALDIVSEESWNDTAFDAVDTILKKFPSKPVATNLSLEDFNQLSAYIDAVNAKMPIYSSVVKSLTKDQDPQAINIKVPEKYKSIKDLTSFNERLEKLFKIIEIDGSGVKFEGFDTGTDWYTIGLMGAGTYHAFLAALKIAQEFYITKTEYFKSETAKLEYEAALATLADDKKFSEKGLQGYKEKRMDLELEKKAKPVVESISNPNGHEESELFTKVIKEVKALVDEMGEGVEFHLSLNPPEYAQEEGGLLTIDYKKIAEQNQKNLSQEKEPKQLDTAVNKGEDKVEK